MEDLIKFVEIAPVLKISDSVKLGLESPLDLTRLSTKDEADFESHFAFNYNEKKLLWADSSSSNRWRS